MRVLIVNNAHGQKSSAFDKLLHICESLGIETVICTTADDVKTAIAAHDTGRELNAAILSGASQHSVVNKVKQDVLRMNASVMTQLEVPVLGNKLCVYRIYRLNGHRGCLFCNLWF